MGRRIERRGRRERIWRGDDEDCEMWLGRRTKEKEKLGLIRERRRDRYVE